MNNRSDLAVIPPYVSSTACRFQASNSRIAFSGSNRIFGGRIEASVWSDLRRLIWPIDASTGANPDARTKGTSSLHRSARDARSQEPCPEAQACASNVRVVCAKAQSGSLISSTKIVRIEYLPTHPYPYMQTRSTESVALGPARPLGRSYSYA